jgi:hypothetical protein
MEKGRRVLLITLGILIILFLLIQLFPYGKDHTNPVVVSEPNWANSQTRDLARRACCDCHSNETIWPWYSSVTPVSWPVVHDVQEGRQKLNFSDWKRGRQPSSGEISEVIQEGEMPPSSTR